MNHGASVRQGIGKGLETGLGIGIASVIDAIGMSVFPLFDILHANLRERKAANGGEEMLRLRAYEKLQNLVHMGMVKKTGKKYKGIATPLAALAAQSKS
jgi:hypothetical protein